MSKVRPVELNPITEADIDEVAEYFHRELGSGASVDDWRRVMTPTWDVEQPNHGYLLREDGRVVGAYHAFYSDRMIAGRLRHICNLGAWCVADEHRAAGLRMLRALLRQRGYTFTDLSPSGNVLGLNARLGFTPLDTTTAMVPNMPWPSFSRGVRVTDTPTAIEALLSDHDRQIYRDHATTAAHHAVLTKNGRSCYVIFRRDRRRNLPLFASILYVGDTDVFRECAPYFFRYLLIRHGILATLAEIRIVGYRPRLSVQVPEYPKMFLSDDLDPEQIDYLYSELTCRPW